MAFESPNPILHIDDKKTSLENIKVILGAKDYPITGVTSGKEGIEELLKNDYFYYDIILLDLDMPEMDGIETFKEIRKINPHIPIIVCSAHFEEDIWEQKLKTLGIEVDRIEKPFPIITSPELPNILNMLENKRKSYRELLYPFMYSYAKFINLSNDEIDRVFEVAFKANLIFVEEYFQQHADIDWVAIAKKPGNVILSGKIDNEPTKGELSELAQKYDTPVFAYTRLIGFKTFGPEPLKQPNEGPGEKIISIYSQIVDVDEGRGIVRLNCKLDLDSNETFERLFPLRHFKNKDDLVVDQSIFVRILERPGEVRYLFEESDENFFEKVEDEDVSYLEDSPVLRRKDS